MSNRALDLRGDNLNKKALTIITIAAMLTSILFVVSSLYAPSSDAPEVNLVLYDADGVKMVSVGETATYVILVENTGTADSNIDISKEGTASGWDSSLSHEKVHLRPGDEQQVSLYVTPTEEDAESSIEVNVVATRGDNVTIISTTTYLSGDVLIRKAGEVNWEQFTQDMDVEEGDDLKTGQESYTQVAFQDFASVVLLPDTELHVRFKYLTDENATFEFMLLSGGAAFNINLPTAISMFTLKMPGDALIEVDSTTNTVFLARANGDILVFAGTVRYTPPQTRQGRSDGETNISAGKDSSGEDFNYAKLQYNNDGVSGIVKNLQNETIGFENDGDFVASGELKGFVFRIDGIDIFFLHGLDIESVTLDIASMKPGFFDLSFIRYDPDLKGFLFKDMNTPSNGKAHFLFKSNEVYLRSESKLSYDFEIRSGETDRFYLNDMTLEPGEGNLFRVLKYVHLENEDVNSVLFGRDTDGDGTIDDEVVIRTGMTGEQVYKDLDEDDDESGYVVLVAALVVIIIIVVMYLILQSGGPGQPLGEPESELSDEEREIEMHPITKPGLMDETEMKDFPEPGEDDGEPGDASETEPPHEGGSIDDEPQGAAIGEDWETTAPVTDFDVPLTEKEFQDEPDEDESSQTLVEDLVDRKKDMILDEDFDKISDLPPELQPIEPENLYALPHETDTLPPISDASVPSDEPEAGPEFPEEVPEEESDEPIDDIPEEEDTECGDEIDDDDDDKDEGEDEGEKEEDDDDEGEDEEEKEDDDDDDDKDEDDDEEEKEEDDDDDDEKEEDDDDGEEEKEEDDDDPLDTDGDEDTMVDYEKREGYDEAEGDPGDLPDDGEGNGDDQEIEEEVKEKDEFLELDLDLFPKEDPVVLPPRNSTRIPPLKQNPEDNGDESAEETQKHSLEDIRNRLHNVRNLKTEMDNLESTSGDDQWWDEWNTQMKSEIASMEKPNE